MANCIFCGQSAGMLKKKHASCEEKHLSGLKLVALELDKALTNSSNINELPSRLKQLVANSFIDKSLLDKLAAKSWSKALDEFLEDGILDEQEEKILAAYIEKLALDESIIEAENNALTRARQARVLRDLINGNLPRNISILGDCPVNLQKGEQIVWIFNNSDYLEDKVRRTYVGGSRGVSVRVAQGVYLRAGAFKGESVERNERVLIDNGTVIITDKNVYFSGSSKSVRVPYKKIVTFLPFDNGLGFIKDNQTAKPQIFITGSGWFIYNLVTNLAKMAA